MVLVEFKMILIMDFVYVSQTGRVKKCFFDIIKPY